GQSFPGLKKATDIQELRSVLALFECIIS
ncbi:MAG: hypothetical protein ACI8W0_000594, partial [Flavobacterium sp.]